MIVVFFCKQKTADELRISDWSSDVCSSDLARCAAGFLFGMTLAAAGEWLRRRPLQRAIAAIGPNYLPPALTAAGVASAFGSLYAAYGLYDNGRASFR